MNYIKFSKAMQAGDIVDMTKNYARAHRISTRDIVFCGNASACLMGLTEFIAAPIHIYLQPSDVLKVQNDKTWRHSHYAQYVQIHPLNRHIAFSDIDRERIGAFQTVSPQYLMYQLADEMTHLEAATLLTAILACVRQANPNGKLYVEDIGWFRRLMALHLACAVSGHSTSDQIRGQMTDLVNQAINSDLRTAAFLAFEDSLKQPG